MKQTYTSKDTSINSTKLPSIYGKVDWNQYLISKNWNPTIVDYGCGKFNNSKEFAEQLDMEWFGYDPYNRSEEENDEAYAAPADVVICSNVLNVIDEDEAVQAVVDDVMMIAEMNGADYFFTIYDGDKSGEGRVSKKDCYQRNEKVNEYLRFFSDYDGVTVRHGVITNNPGAVR